MPSPPELTTLLHRLSAANLELILVGGLAAVAQGAPITTHDADVVHRRSGENVDALIAFLGSVHARYRGRSDALAPNREALLGAGHHLLVTDLGPLDVLGAIEGGRGYEDLLPATIELQIAGHPLRVLGLQMLLELKRDSTHPKDKLTFAILEETIRRGG